MSCLNDFRPVTLTSTVMKCFERLIMAQIKRTIDVTVDARQNAYRKNRSTANDISTVPHLNLTHLEKKDSYIRQLYLDFSSAFNTITPQTVVNKLSLLGLIFTPCNRIF